MNECVGKVTNGSQYSIADIIYPKLFGFGLSLQEKNLVRERAEQGRHHLRRRLFQYFVLTCVKLCFKDLKHRQKFCNLKQNFCMKWTKGDFSQTFGSTSSSPPVQQPLPPPPMVFQNLDIKYLAGNNGLKHNITEPHVHNIKSI